jgi:hypothetical protein
MSMLNMTTRCGDLDLTLSPAGLDDYHGIRTRSVRFTIDDLEIRVASLDDIIRSKTAADRPKDHATLPILHALREEIDRGSR